jgi:predicted MFS family arabinose efflux permease
MSSASACPTHTEPGAGITLLLACACGAIVANLYYAQPLAGLIAGAIGLPSSMAGLVVTLSQMGYCLGLLLVVPLGDLVENRRLVVATLSLGVLALLMAAFSAHSGPFLMAAFCIGLTSVVAQVLVPFATHLASDATRGRMVGNVMSGLMLGILISRPLASFIASAFGWHAVFLFSAAAMASLSILLHYRLPERRPHSSYGYVALLRSMWSLWRTTPVLRQRAGYQFFMFCSFSMFWTTTPLLLAGSAYHFSQVGIALFALAGVTGAIAAPIAGRLADRGLTRRGTGLAFVLAFFGYAISLTANRGGAGYMALLVASAVLLDMGVTANLVLGQRAIFAQGAETRSRMNGLFMAIFFMGGAIGSVLGAWLFAQYGWPLVAIAGMALATIPFAVYLTHKD